MGRRKKHFKKLFKQCDKNLDKLLLNLPRGNVTGKDSTEVGTRRVSMNKIEKIRSYLR